MVNLTEKTTDFNSREVEVEVVSEQREDFREIRLYVKGEEGGRSERAYFAMKDFGTFVYFSGIRVDEELRGRGIARSFIERAQTYLETSVPPKFGFVNNQISHSNSAREMYRAPDWLNLSERNWKIYIPKNLRNSSVPLEIPLRTAEIDEMVATCKKN